MAVVVVLAKKGTWFTRCVVELRLVYSFCFDLDYVFGKKRKRYGRGRRTKKE